MVIIFYFGSFLFKVCNNACIVPSLAKQNILIHFHSLFLKLMILLILKIPFLQNSIRYQTIILHSKSVILILLCLVLTNSLF